VGNSTPVSGLSSIGFEPTTLLKSKQNINSPV
jgi:hypothetical protein